MIPLTRTRPAFAFLVAVCTAFVTPAVADPRLPRAADPVEIGDVVNLVGTDLARPGEVGTLMLSARGIAFAHGAQRTAVPFTAVRGFAIEHSNMPLLRGVKGTIAGFAPQGAGQLYSAIRPGAETLTLLYADQDHGLHYAALVLPKTRKVDVLRAFGDAGLIPGKGPLGAIASLAPPPPGQARLTRRAALTLAQPSVRVTVPRVGVQPVPAVYLAGIYEDVIARLAKSGRFASIWRDGDVHAEPNALTLTVAVTDVRKGSARVRGALPVVGMVLGKTLIAADIDLRDADGTVLLHRSLKGSKRTPGESLAASASLATRIDDAVSRVTVNSAAVENRL